MEIVCVFLVCQCIWMGCVLFSFVYDVEQVICYYLWLGNVCELENVIEWVVIFSESQEIYVDLLGIDIELDDFEDDFVVDFGFGLVGVVVSNYEFIEDFLLEDYFQYFVFEYQDYMIEIELVCKLGISCKCLWECCQCLGIL